MRFIRKVTAKYRVTALDKKVSDELIEQLRGISKDQSQKVLDEFVQRRRLSKDEIDDLMYDLGKERGTGWHNLHKPSPVAPVKMTQHKVDDVLTAYREAILQTLRRAAKNQDIDAPLSEEALKESERDVKVFLDKAAAKGIDLDDFAPDHIGYGFWYTRDGNLSGFLDGDYKGHGDALNDIARSFRKKVPYLGHEGQVHFK